MKELRWLLLSQRCTRCCMRSANRLLQRCRLSAVASARAIGGHWRAAPLICKPPAVWLESSRTTHADSAVPPAGGPLAVYTRGVASGKYRADPQQVRHAPCVGCARRC